MTKYITRVIYYPVVLLSIVILGYLTITSINSTVYLTEYENVFFVTDKPVIHLVVFLVFLCLTIAVRRLLHVYKIDFFKQHENILVVVSLVIYSVILIALFSKWKLLPTFDQEKVFNIAADMVNHNYEAFLSGGYAEKWTNQWGYLILLSLIYRIFGIRNVAAIYVLNIVCMVGTIYYIYAFCKKIFGEKSVIILACTCMFMPMWNYYSFIYGNIPANFLCIVSLYLLSQFLDKRNKWLGFAAGFCMALAIALKTTALIFFLGILVYIVIAIINKEWNKKELLINFAVMLWFIIACSISGRMINTYIERITGMELGNGVPRIAHIAMSMHESGTKTAGWYDGYIDRVYEEAGYDYYTAETLAKMDLNESMQRFIHNPTGAVGFFCRKINSAWIEPTFEGIEIMLNRNVYSETADVNVNRLQTGITGDIFAVVCNYMQSMIYIGALAYCIDLFKNNKYKQIALNMQNDLFFAIHFVGMFLFYLLWEVNSQYTFFAVLLLIPYSVMGIDNLSNTVSNIIFDRHENVYEKAKSQFPNFIIYLAILGIIVVSRIIPEENSIARMFYPSWSTLKYSEYKEELASTPIKQSEYIKMDDMKYATKYDSEGKALLAAGRYLISSVSDRDCYLTESDVLQGSCIKSISKEEPRINLISNDKGYIFRFQNTQFVMDVSMGSKEPGTVVQTWTQNGDPSQYFSIVPVSNSNDSDEIEKYYIKYSTDLYLTLNDDKTVTVEELEGNENQQWIIVKTK